MAMGLDALSCRNGRNWRLFEGGDRNPVKDSEWQKKRERHVVGHFSPQSERV